MFLVVHDDFKQEGKIRFTNLHLVTTKVSVTVRTIWDSWISIKSILTKPKELSLKIIFFLSY